MSVLPGGQPLDRVLPDLDDLLADPHAYLSEAPLAIGPRRMYRLAGMFAIPGLALLLSCYFHQDVKTEGERLALGVGLLIGAGVWLGWSIMLRGHELVLHPDGVEVTCNDTTVWAPWSLFHVEGRPLIPDSDSPRAGLTLPINPAAVHLVELRRDGMSVAWGRQVEGPQWSFTGRDEVVLPGRYEVSAQDVGDLLLVLGNRLGKEAPPPPAGGVPDTPSQVVADDPSGWITVPLTRLKLPPCCASCGGPRDDTLHVRVTASGDWVIGLLVGGIRGAEVPVPVCEVCKERIVNQQRAGGWVGLAIGAILGTAAGLFVGGWQGEGRDLALYLGAFVGLFLGSFIGSTLGLKLSDRSPIRLRRYSPSRGLVSVRFENPEIAARVLAALRARDGWPDDEKMERKL